MSAAWTTVKRQLIEAVEWPLKHAELFAEAGVRPPKGMLLSGAARLRQDAAGQGRRQPDAGQLHLGQGAGAAVEIRGRVGAGRPRGLPARPSRPPPASSSSTRSTRWCPTRGGGGSDSHVTERVIGQFLAEMDGVEELNGVLVLAATNRPDILDPALLRPGRFDVQLEIPLPDTVARAEIFRIGLRDRPVAEGVSREPGRAERGLHSADIQAVCDQAVVTAIGEAREAVDLDKPGRVLDLPTISSWL